MRLGLELVARTAIPLRLGTYFETWLATCAGTVRRSLGRDEYHLGLVLRPGQRLAATGRTHICQIDLEAAELGTNGARPALPAEADLSTPGPVVWGIRTNLFLDPDDLAARAGGRLVVEGRPPLDFPLTHPSVQVKAVGPGRYIIDLTGLIPECSPP